jgi:8-oxo-dGTP pyrophosphatase MutT (NUDIX family)
MTKEKSIGGVVYRSNRDFLLLHRADSGIWEFIQGHPQGNEEEITTLQRELKEEGGILFSAAENSDIATLIEGFREEINYNSPSRRIERVVALYLIHYDGPIILSAEHDRYGWFPLEVALSTIYQDQRAAILPKAAMFIPQGISTANSPF